MKEKNGYAIKEIIILSAILAVVFTFAIVRVSFAYEEKNDKNRTSELKNNALLVAAEYYAKKNSEKFKKEESFLYGSDLIEAGFLMDIEEFDYRNSKLKVTYDEQTKKYNIEIVE